MGKVKGLKKEKKKKKTHLLHVLICLGHFCKVVIRPLGGDAVFTQQRQRCEDGRLSLTVAESQQTEMVSIHIRYETPCRPNHIVR